MLEDTTVEINASAHSILKLTETPRKKEGVIGSKDV